MFFKTMSTIFSYFFSNFLAFNSVHISADLPDIAQCINDLSQHSKLPRYFKFLPLPKHDSKHR